VIDGRHPLSRPAWHGDDDANETLVTAMVGGAAKGALDTGASPELVAMAIQRAFQEHPVREEEAAVRLYTEVVEGRR